MRANSRKTQGKRKTGIILVFSIWALSICAFGQAVPVRFVSNGSAWELQRNGASFYVKGACGTSNLDLLKEYGGNSIRTYSPSLSALDSAHARGLTVLLGITTNETTARTQVMQYKDHPALLMWGIGNEEETRSSDVVSLWQRINRIAQMIHDVDGNHPAITVIAELGSNKLQQLNQYAPDLDGVGVNAYGSVTSVASRVAQNGWTRPFLIAEFGPRGHWEVPKESWGVPIEQSSSEKELNYLNGYKSFDKKPNCAGSYVFLWGQKQEKTHTWYGMFLSQNLGGHKLNPVDAMHMAWRGQYPENRCPAIGSKKISIGTGSSLGDGTQRFFPPGYRFWVELDVTDPEEDSLTVIWDLRPDVTDNSATGGSYEPPSEPISGAVVFAEGKRAVIQIPEQEGLFRVHAYAVDREGNAATVNQGIVVGSQYTISDPPATGAISAPTFAKGITVQKVGDGLVVRNVYRERITVELFSLSGKVLARISGDRPELHLKVNSIVQSGYYLIRITGRDGRHNVSRIRM